MKHWGLVVGLVLALASSAASAGAYLRVVSWNLLHAGYSGQEDWNDYVIIAKGNHLIHKINGNVTSEVIDNQEDKRAMSGILALQVHVGPPMANVETVDRSDAGLGEAGEGFGTV